MIKSAHEWDEDSNVTDNGTTTISAPPPGWYTDPQGAQRWWDGTQWTAHVAPAVAAEAAPVVSAAAGVAAPTVDITPIVAPAVTPPVQVGTRSQDLLPGAAAPKASRNPLAALPLSPRMWIGAGAALVALAVGVFFFMRPGDATPEGPVAQPAAAAPRLPAASGALLTAKQATAALPVFPDPTTGLVADPAKTLKGKYSATGPTIPAACSAAFNSIGEGPRTGRPVQSATTSFRAAAGGLVGAVSVKSFATAPPSSVITAAKGLLPTCATFAVKALPAAKFRITSVTFPVLGEGAFLASLATTIGTTPIVTQELVIRQGHNLVIIDVVARQASSSQLMALGKATLARLPH